MVMIEGEVFGEKYNDMQISAFFWYNSAIFAMLVPVSLANFYQIFMFGSWRVPRCNMVMIEGEVFGEKYTDMHISAILIK